MRALTVAWMRTFGTCTVSATRSSVSNALRRDPHVDPMERVVQNAHHVVRRLDVSHPAAPAGSSQQVGTSTHGFAASGHGGAQRQRTRVAGGAIAKVLEDVALGGERCMADPGSACVMLPVLRSIQVATP